MSRVLVIGYGNTLRGDDAAGVRAAELVAHQYPEFQYVYLHQLVPELSEQIAESDIVFFIDAQQDITQPTVRLIASDMDTDQPRTHFISPESLLALTRRLFQRGPSKAYTIGIPATEFDFSEQLSPATSSAVMQCADLVKEILKN